MAEAVSRKVHFTHKLIVYIYFPPENCPHFPNSQKLKAVSGIKEFSIQQNAAAVSLQYEGWMWDRVKCHNTVLAF